MKLETLDDLLTSELRDLYSAENQLIKALPKMAKAASSEELKSAFQEHLEQTREQAGRLEKIAKQLNITLRGKKCVAMEGLIEEGKEQMSEDMEPDVMDAALIAAAQKVEHYEMAGYGCARTWARQLGHDEAADLLQTTLDEEGQTDKRLTDIAESYVNEAAESAP